MSERISIQLSKQEALVLFDLLARNESVNEFKIDDKSERMVLDNICSLLESLLEEPLAENYEDLLNKARANVKNGGVEE